MMTSRECRRCGWRQFTDDAPETAGRWTDSDATKHAAESPVSGGCAGAWSGAGAVTLDVGGLRDAEWLREGGRVCLREGHLPRDEMGMLVSDRVGVGAVLSPLRHAVHL